ncbi:MAG: glycine cleavage system protein H [Deltaproteobacteria bacterium]|nr:glycine cleavage system protein H [Deltaproteobacteria bacterium]
MMETYCPFLKDEKMAFCKGFPVRKMLPYDRLYHQDNICIKEEHLTCPVYRAKDAERLSGHSSNKKVCPYLEVEEVLFCEVYPVKKMIPSSAFKLECPCTTEAYIDCPAYCQIAQGDRASGETMTVRGFLLDDTVYYHRGHLWLQRVNGKVRLGLDDFGQWLLGDIDKISFPRRKEHVERNKPLLRIRCSHGTAEIASPLSGTLMNANEEVRRDTSLINTDPYGAGWLVELRLAEAELDRLEQGGEGFIATPGARRWLEDEIDRLHGVLETEIGITMSDGGQLIDTLRDVVTQSQWGILIKTFLEN